MTGYPLTKKVAIFAHSGKGNLGDEATMTAVLRNVRLRHPGADVWAFTLDPADTQARHEVSAFPIRRPRAPSRAMVGPPQAPGDGARADAVAPAGRIKRWIRRIPVLGSALRGLWRAVETIPAVPAELAFLAKSSRRLKGVDLFIVAGGGQLGDYFGGAWGFPYTIFKWSLMARARGAKLAFLSVGAGPIGSPLSKLFFRWSLSMASYRSFRDESSRTLIESLGVSRENHVFPDLVHGLEPSGPGSGRRGSGCVVGINPLPFHDSRYWAEDVPDVYERYVHTLASFAVRVIEAGHNVLLFPTQVVADPPVIKHLESLIRDRLPAPRGSSLLCPHVSSFDELLAAIDETDIVVASRFHGIIISLLMSKPVIGLAYNQKTDDLLADLGLGDYVADIGSFEVAWLISQLDRLLAGGEDVRRRFESRRSDYRSALEDQYRTLLGNATEPSFAPVPLTA
jgi:polysaccharide pyruvyl transferase WcaK-like protein